jgi:hypothetical protein
VGEVGLVTDIDMPLTDDDMPRFTVLAQDALALDVLRFYIDECHRRGLHRQAEQVVQAHAEMADWRKRHPDRIKNPDHTHRPVR